LKREKGRENGGDYERRARREREKKWEQEKGEGEWRGL
jgi:hypothetical protein